MAAHSTSTPAPASQAQQSIGNLKTAAEEAMGHAQGVWALADLAVESIVENVQRDGDRYYADYVRECDLAGVYAAQRLMRDAISKASEALQALMMAVR